jgi:DNA cross-link repair 1B protein
MIYCSKETGILLSLKYPGVSNQLKYLDYNTPTDIWINEGKNIKVTVTMMDANHIIGSCMFLYTGYFGSVLYTGDLRYHKSLLTKNDCLFSVTGELKVHIDELILDNTYCDPIFNFPTQVK